MPRRIYPLLFGLLLIAGVVGLRAPWLGHDVWSLDEGATFTMAQQVLEGDVLYRDAADHRSPLVPYLKALVFAVAGDWNAYAVHLVLAILLGGCAIVLAGIGRKLDGALTGAATGLAFVILQFFFLDAGVGGDAMSANTEWFVVIFSTIGFGLLVRALDQPKFSSGPLIGFFFALSLLCKQPGLLDFIVATVLLILISISAGSHRKNLLQLWLGMIAGLCIPLVVTIIYFIYQGAFEDYVYYAFTFNTALYVPEVPFAERLIAIRRPFLMAWFHVPVLAVLGAVGGIFLLRAVVKEARLPTPRFSLFPWLILGWTASGLIATTLSGREFAHYSEQVIPGLSLAIGWITSRLFKLSQPLPVRWRRVAIVCFLALIVVGPATRYRSIAADFDFALATPPPVGPIVQRFTHADERIFVWGYFPEIYYHAKRLPATRFVYANFITGLIPWTNTDSMQDVEYAVSPDGWKKFYADLADHPPALIVDTRFRRTYVKFPIAKREPLWTEIETNYAQVAIDQSGPSRMRFFRRLSPLAQPANPHQEITDPGLLSVSGFAPILENEPPCLEVSGPAGFDHLELWINGMLVSSFDTSPVDTISTRFFIPGQHFAATSVEVRAVGPSIVASSEPFDFASFARQTAARLPPQPVLQIGKKEIRPLQLFTTDDDVPPHTPIPGTWQLVAPTRIEYEAPAGLARIAFSHGITPSSFPLTDGYDLEINWLTSVGARQQLWFKRVTPRKSGRMQMTQEEDIILLPRAAGRLEFVFYSGEISNSDNDLLFFGNLTGFSINPEFILGETIISAESAHDPNGIALRTTPEGYWSVHSPSRIVFTRPPNLMTFSFEYGLEEGAYNSDSSGHSDGVRFKLEFLQTDGTSTLLFEHILDPFKHPNHRGLQTTEVSLPRLGTGQLILTIGPGYGEDGSWDWGLVGNFRAFKPGPPLIISPERMISTIHTSGHDGGWSDKLDDTHWGAATPQELVYPKPIDLFEVTINFGLYENAAADENGQRRSDGVEAVLIFTSDQGEKHELYRRRLDPFSDPKDHGQKSATIKLPIGESGTLTLKMEPGAAGNTNYDWAYWGPFSGQVVDPR